MSSRTVDNPDVRGAPAPRVPAAPGVARGVRLTRRGRLVVFAAFLLAALAVVVLSVAGAASGSGERSASPPVRMVQVEVGDTLWSIATAAEPDSDPRELIAEIEELNALDGSLPVGREIAVPVGD